MKKHMYRHGMILVACMLAGCACPASFREVPAPQVKQPADVARLTDCQMRHYGATLLAQADSAAMVQALVQAGADVHGKHIINGKEYPGSPLLQANKSEVVHALLRSGADPNAAGGKRRYTPLCDAVRNGKAQKVQLLLKGGAHPTLADSKGESPLYIAAMRADTAMCRQLLGAGAAVDIGLQSDGTTPLMALMRAAHAGKLPQAEADATAELLMSAGARVDMTDAEGNTLLHYATPALVQRLLAAGLSPHATNHLGRTPLFHSLDRTVVDALLGAGADIQAQDGEGNSAFDVVPSPQVKSYLLFRGCRSGRPL
ncbi:MAG: ankyrin repeat domain-containing protein [Akkermansia sp.]|nr:ankyrin repeat domain-containing protein [Akkermansia sp.]